ncbi:rhamnulose-1-phosphate aldolase [Clostridium carboxidivorans P7]|uniref:Rhamnulose-1-phosphate aldolase n=1 Tax=Clostridium carboxidivorans P7 TaxID=536227 RepID=C6PNM4_9CLOT|nr:rhamnulose-1-phosphate aldolase [Clostridium carboxidivorans]AKN32847.1 rhamnulose-1-phosphate aldolase [Clostridium carboxidivorans P7]EET89151.1 Rhamnulose-1-phosphate aldolase [Clostridium carboxidivorans P7]EFG89909.1 putative rhamnulose-1-phosphate aldolase [Clostridium carboxidivorans P7]
MKVENAKFVKDYIKITYDAWLKGWHERNGGNLSYRIGEDEIKDVKDQLSENSEFVPIGVSVSNLANEYFLVTGSGKYMRNVILDPEANIGIAKIDDKGENYKIVWGLLNGAKPTSEFPSHLMSHSVKKEATGGKNKVIYHSHTTNLIALTFVLPLDSKVFTRELWEMATECPVVFPSGVGVVPWMVPGGAAIARETSKLMEEFDVVIWAHHGTFVAGETMDLAFGLMDTAEKSAEILVKVLSMGGKKQTITADNFRDLAKEFHVTLPEKFLYE